MRQQILNDIKGEYYQDNYPNDGQRFVAWYLRNIHGLNIVEALGKDKPRIDFNFKIEPDKFMQMQLNNVKTILAAIPLSECVNIPSIKDGRLFRQNIRQSLGRSNKVNKSFGYILFKFYEITNKTKTDKITNNTNSQSAVKAIDMRSNDKTVKGIKKTYEHEYSDGQFITKRGEQADPLKYNVNHVYELSAFGKQLMAWHSQRPNISYGEEINNLSDCLKLTDADYTDRYSAD